MRAVADDHQAALSVGISLNQIWVIVWFAAGVVALATGIMWGARSEVSFALQVVALKALPVLILGGLTSIPGAIVGGLIIGIGEKLGEFYWGPLVGGGIESWLAYAIALAFLLFRPQGLFGERSSRGFSDVTKLAICDCGDAKAWQVFYREAGQFKTTYAADMAIFPIRQDRIGLALILLVAFVVIPADRRRVPAQHDDDPVPDPVAGGDRPQHPHRLHRPAVARLGGVHGRRRLCLLQARQHFPQVNILVWIVASGFVSSAVGVVFGLPSLRIKGFYLAVATLAAQFFLEWCFARIAAGSTTTTIPARSRSPTTRCSACRSPARTRRR